MCRAKFTVSGPRNGLESSVPVKILTFWWPRNAFLVFLGPQNGVPLLSGLLSPLAAGIVLRYKPEMAGYIIARAEKYISRN